MPDVWLSRAHDLPTLSQRDARWSRDYLGFSRSHTIGEWGCAIVSITMALNAMGIPVSSPTHLNDALKKLGEGKGFIGARVVWRGVEHLYQEVKLRAHILCRTSPAPVDFINSMIAEDNPVLVEMDMSPNPGLQTHWVLIVGSLDSGKDYIIHDPWPLPHQQSKFSLVDRYGFRSKNPKVIITRVVVYSKSQTG